MRFFRQPRSAAAGIPTMSVRDLKRRLDRGEETLVLDVRHAGTREDLPGSIPGSVRIPPEELPERYGELPRDRLIVAYCT